MQFAQLKIVPRRKIAHGGNITYLRLSKKGRDSFLALYIGGQKEKCITFELKVWVKYHKYKRPWTASPVPIELNDKKSLKIIFALIFRQMPFSCVLSL